MWTQPYTTLRDAFLFHVQIADLDECWYWVGTLSPSGYGQLSWQSRHYWAHQLAYRFWHGPIIYRDVGNTCGNKACCNPTHIYNAPHSVAVRTGMAWRYNGDVGHKAERDAMHKQLTQWKSTERARLRTERDERKKQERALRPPRVLLSEEDKRGRRRAYYRRPEVIARKQAFLRAYYSTSRGRAVRLKYRRKYAKLPYVRERKKINDYKRIARKYGNPLCEAELIIKWETKWRRKKRVRCYWCQNEFPPRQCHTDHIEALANGGAHILANVCISCMECNCVKFTKPLQNWNRWLEQPVLL